MRRYFARGLIGILPIMLTLVVIVAGFRFIDEYVGVPITQKIAQFSGDTAINAIVENKWFRAVVTLVASFVVIILVGTFLATFTGRKIYSYFERLLLDFPIIKKIYPSAKQLTEFFFAEKKHAWSSVVAVQYPRTGMWSLGFLMGDAPQELSQKAGKNLVSVYTPTSPMPFTGYVVCLPANEVLKLDLSVEDALHWIVSAGVVLPQLQQQRTGSLKS